MNGPIDKSSHFQGEQRLYMIVARKIARMIEDNSVNRNWRMPSERELCELLDVSRSVVREAVVALEIQGIVEVRGRSGIVVRPKQEDDVRRSNTSLDAVFTSSDLIEARAAIATSTAGLSAVRANPRDLAFLEELLAKISQGNLDRQVLAEADSQFYFALARISGNPMLQSFASQVQAEWDRSSPLQSRLGRLEQDDLITMWVGGHFAVLTAIKNRQSEAASKAVARYLRNLRAELDLVDKREEAGEEPETGGGTPA